MSAIIELVAIPLLVLAALVVLGVVTSVSVGTLLVVSMVVIVGSLIGMVRLARYVERSAGGGRRQPNQLRWTHPARAAGPPRPRHP